MTASIDDTTTRITSVIVSGAPTGNLGAGEVVWYTAMFNPDMAPRASMLQAPEGPPTGGNTSFGNMFGICDVPPAALKERVAALEMQYVGTCYCGGAARQVSCDRTTRASPGVCVERRRSHRMGQSRRIMHRTEIKGERPA